MNPSTMKIYEYPIEEYNFPKIIADYLKADDLTCLETDVSLAAGAQHSLYKNMEQATLYKRLYDGLSGATGQQFYQTYERFIQKVVRAQFSEPIYYQKKPTHRILFLNNPGESRFHRDRDYGHSTAEINYLVPQTPAYDTNTFWLESEEGKEDFKPVNMQIGGVCALQWGLTQARSKSEYDRKKSGFVRLSGHSFQQSPGFFYRHLGLEGGRQRQSAVQKRP